MKNNFFILIFFLLVGCTPNTTATTKVTAKTTCPIVLFSAKHSKYITGNTQIITSENIRYRAEINNYAFNSECSIKDNIFQAELSLLFIVKPDLTKESSITLPFYVAVLNINDEVAQLLTPALPRSSVMKLPKRDRHFSIRQNNDRHF